MHKRPLFSVILAVFFFTATAQKFGVVDTEAIIDRLPDISNVKTVLDTASSRYEAEFTVLKQEMEKKYAELQQLPATMPQEIVKRRIQELQELDQKIQQFRQTATQDLQQHEQRLMAPIRERVAAAIKTVGEEGGFLIIFESTAPAYMRDDVVNVNNLVIEKLTATTPQQ